MDQSFRGIDPGAVGRVCCIGAGPIGAGWTAYFLARGYQVTAYLHEPGEEASLRALIATENTTSPFDAKDQPANGVTKAVIPTPPPPINEKRSATKPHASKKRPSTKTATPRRRARRR